MKVFKKVTVKQILTPKSKQRLKENFQYEKLKLERECQQLNFEKRKMIQRSHISKQTIEKRFAKELNKRKEKISLIDFKLSQLEQLEYGAKIVEREINALVEVKEGMNWDELMKEQSIVIKDGIVVNIENK